MSTAHLTEATKLATDALVELYTLDTTGLVTIGGLTGAGQVYNWTPGTLPQRLGGVVVSATTNAVQLDQLIHASVTGGYSVQVFAADGKTIQQVAVSGFSVGAGGMTLLNLAGPLSSLPAAGTNYVVSGPGSVSLGGVVYLPFPITVTGFEWNGQGKLPRPKMRIDNTIRAPGTNIPLAAALAITFSDILGATVTRRRTFAGMLDGQPHADPTAVFEADQFRVDRKSLQNRSVIEFELAASIDQMGIKLPARQILRDTCNFRYRRWNATTGQFVYDTCPYTGGAMFTYAGVPTTDPSQDVCRKLLGACTLRFGVGARIPISAFPGVGLTSL
jgi:lambda family phage minor tail protein L